MTRDEKYNIRKYMELRAVLDNIGKAVYPPKAPYPTCSHGKTTIFQARVLS